MTDNAVRTYTFVLKNEFEQRAESNRRLINQRWARLIGPYGFAIACVQIRYYAFTDVGWRVVLAPCWLERLQPLALPLCLPKSSSMSRVFAIWVMDYWVNVTALDFWFGDIVWQYRLAI